jgi:hypothetical protein
MNQAERARTDYERATALYQQSLEKRKATLGPDDTKTISTMWDLVVTGVMAGQFDRIEPVLLDLLERSKRKDEVGRPHNQLAELGKILVDQERYAPAEPILRECLTIRTKEMPENWLRFNAASMLGGALLGQKKYDEAKPFLLAGYEGMKKHKNQVPPDDGTRLAKAGERIVRLFEATNQSEQARLWKEKLAATKKPKDSK